MSIAELSPAYPDNTMDWSGILTLQKSGRNTAACLQTILYRNLLGSYDRGTLDILFAEPNRDRDSHVFAYRAATAELTKQAFDDTVHVLFLEDRANALFKKYAPNLTARYYPFSIKGKESNIWSWTNFISETVGENKDTLVRYDGGKIHMTDNILNHNGKYTGLIERYRWNDDKATIICPSEPPTRTFVTKQAFISAISDKYETGILVISNSDFGNSFPQPCF
jgi:hypothetical protein